MAALLGALLSLSCQGRARMTVEKDPFPPAPNAMEAGERPGGTPPHGDTAGNTSPLWRIEDRGTKCVRAPCPSLLAVRLDGSGESVAVAELDVSGLGLTAKDTERLRTALRQDGLRVRGELETRVDPRGSPYRVLRATALPSR